jgi:hypothetical protein
MGHPGPLTAEQAKELGRFPRRRRVGPRRAPGEPPDGVLAGSASGVKGETAPRSARDRQIPKAYG